MASKVTASAFVAKAVSQRGNAERTGNNDNKFTEWWWGKGTRGGAYAWCAVFTCWVAQNAGDKGLVPWSASCSAQVRQWKSRGQWVGKGRPKVGDIFYVPGGPTGYSHVGIVAAVYSSTFLSIEGNWGNKVQQVTRKISGYHYARPAFASSGTAPKPPAKKPHAGKRVDLSQLVAAAKADTKRKQGGQTAGSADDVKIVEDCLRREGLLAAKYAGDGSFGSLTVTAYSKWQQRLGYKGKDADGVPGSASLKKLGSKYGFSVVA